MEATPFLREGSESSLVGIDELPGDPIDGDVEGKVKCPECDRYFLQRGLKRHITMAHGNPVDHAPKKHGGVNIAEAWAELERGIGFLAGFACPRCGSVLIQRATPNGMAVDQFCEKRPDLRKSIVNMLKATDYIILGMAVSQTVLPMLAHHGIGPNAGLLNTQTGVQEASPEHHEHADPMAGLLAMFLDIPEEDRNAMMNSAFEVAKQNGGMPGFGAGMPTAPVDSNWETVSAGA
jgi:uncharacterized C2H2 Zn-finger protein